MISPYVVDAVKSVVDKVRTRYDLVNTPKLTPYFLHGHISDVIAQLSEKTKSSTYKYQKYPLIILVQDFKETVKNDYLVEVDVTIIIVAESRPDFTASERMTATFKPVLYPLYSLLIEEFEKSKDFHQYEFDHDKTDRMYWGKTGIYGNTGNIANDFLDAIEIENLKLTLKKTC